MTRARGFTLIEVLVAMAVLAIGLGAITVTMTHYVRHASSLRDRALATWIAHNRLTEIELEPVWPEVGESDGDVEYAGRDWRWDAVVIETSDEHLRRVDIEVRLLEDTGGREARNAPVMASLTAFIGDSGREEP